MNSLLPIFQPLGAVARRLVMWLVWACMVLLASPVQAQGSPFTCDVVFYQMRNSGANSLVVKFQSVSATVTPTAVYAAPIATNINSIGYNPVDNYIYGLLSATGTPQLYRIGQSGYQLIGPVQTTAIAGTALTAFTPTGAVFDAAGRYYFVGQGTGITPPRVFRVDSIPLTGAVEVSHIYNLTPSFSLNFGDFDFNGAGGPAGLLMGATGTVHHRLQLTPSASSPLQGTALLTTATIATVGNVGSAFYDAFTGRFFVFNNAVATDNFFQILNPDVGVPSSVITPAVTYPGPPVFPGPFSPTDGTSCPISGARVADLGITKSDARTTVTAAGVTAYSITVTNAGPYPANYSVVRDPPTPGLQKLSVTCSAPGGPPSAVCPATLSTTTFEAGVQILTFPPGTTLVFTLNALVTNPVGSLVTNTATVTPAVDTADPNLTNNISVDVNAVAGTTTTVISGGQQCPAGSVQSSINLLSNGDFSAAAPFLSDAVIGGINTYAPSNHVARQTGTQSYLPALPPPSGIVQNPFPGDGARSVPGGDSWLLHNGKTGAANYRIWYQPVTGLTVGRVYQAMVYVSNATRPSTTSATVPDLRIQVASGAATVTVAALAPANETLATGDRWTLVQGTFTATATAMTVSVADFAAASAEPGGGDVAGLAQATLRECRPAANVRVSKTDGTATVVSTGTTAYTITVSNPSTVTATNTLIVDPPVANFIKGTITCVVVAGSAAGTACPTALSILGMEGAGLTIPLIGLNSTVSFVVRGTVTGPPGNTITNIATVSGVGYTDPDTSDNQATDIDGILGRANLLIAKTNLVTSLVSGTTTSYTVTISNFGPSSVNNAVFQDPAAAGLSCTSVTCTAVIGAATCPSAASTTIALMQGGGIVIPSMVPPSSVVFSVSCNVTATGN
jgi:uncharacterized repeat protein (TIGR01451 family)